MIGRTRPEDSREVVADPAEAATPTNGHGDAPARRVPGAVLVAAAAGVVSVGTLVLALTLTGAAPEPAPAGLPDAGLGPAWGLRVARLLLDLTAVLTIGCLVTAGLLLRSDRGALGPAARGAVRAGAWCAVAWVVTALASFVLTTSDVTGLPPSQLTTGWVRTFAETPQGRALLFAAVVAAVVAVAARQARSVQAAVLLLVLALAALLPVGVAGHASSAGDHDVAVSALVVHVAAAAVWVGGLAGVVLLVRRHPGQVPEAAQRFSGLALVAFVALGGSGLLVATTRLSTSWDAWTSGYGAVVAAKAGAFVLLGLAGLAHRRRTLLALGAARPSAFLRLAGGELVLMAAATGLAAALSRTPVPALPAPDEPLHGGGHSTLPSEIDPVSFSELATEWRINAVLVLVLGVALAAYLAGVRALARQGRTWPHARTAAFTAGVALGLVATCSGIATYAPAMVSIQIAQLLLVLLPVPALLAIGAPLTLWLQWLEVRGRSGEEDAPRRVLDSSALRVLSDPFVGAALACALLLGLYRSSLIEVSLSSSWVHLLTLLLALTAGLLLFWPVLGLDPAPGARSRMESAACVAGVVGCLGLLAFQLRSGDQLLAAEWFLELRWSWIDPVVDQRTGGALAGIAAVSLALLTAVPLIRPRASAGSAPARRDG